MRRQPAMALGRRPAEPHHKSTGAGFKRPTRFAGPYPLLPASPAPIFYFFCLTFPKPCLQSDPSIRPLLCSGPAVRPACRTFSGVFCALSRGFSPPRTHHRVHHGRHAAHDGSSHRLHRGISWAAITTTITPLTMYFTSGGTPQWFTPFSTTPHTSTPSRTPRTVPCRRASWPRRSPPPRSPPAPGSCPPGLSPAAGLSEGQHPGPARQQPRRGC